MTKKQLITNERHGLSARASKSETQARSLDQVSLQRPTFMIKAAVDEFYLADQMVKAPCQRPGGEKGDGCLMSGRLGFTW
jgi:hypothetical protein